MRGDLEHTVRRSIYDQFAGAHMLVPVICNDLCAGVRLVAQNISTGTDTELLQYLLGKSVRIGRQGLGRINTCDLPVSDGSILSTGTLCHTGISCHGMRCLLSDFHTVDVKQPQVSHMIHMEIGTFGYTS